MHLQLKQNSFLHYNVFVKRVSTRQIMLLTFPLSFEICSTQTEFWLKIQYSVVCMTYVCCCAYFLGNIFLLGLIPIIHTYTNLARNFNRIFFLPVWSKKVTFTRVKAENILSLYTTFWPKINIFYSIIKINLVMPPPPIPF